jgi:hypothetical protein
MGATMAPVTVNIDDPANYKLTGKLEYEIFACRPPVGTKFENILEKAKYETTETECFVMAGMLGELWTVREEVLYSVYSYSGRPLSNILINSLRKDVNVRTDSKGFHRAFVLDWVRVRTIPKGMDSMACHVPISQQGDLPTSGGTVLKYNHPYAEEEMDKGLTHGLGDFIVCGMLPGGKPDLEKRRVVNGYIFGKTYNSVNFSDKLDKSLIQRPGVTIKDLPTLYKIATEEDFETGNVSKMKLFG